MTKIQLCKRFFPGILREGVYVRIFIPNKLLIEANFPSSGNLTFEDLKALIQGAEIEEDMVVG